MSRFDYDSADYGNRQSSDAPADPYWPDPAQVTPPAPAAPGGVPSAPPRAGGSHGATSAARHPGGPYADDRYADDDRHPAAPYADTDRYADDDRHAAAPYPETGRYAGTTPYADNDRYADTGRYADTAAYADDDPYADNVTGDAAVVDDDRYGSTSHSGETEATDSGTRSGAAVETDALGGATTGAAQAGKRRRGRRRAGPGRPPTVPSRAGRNLPAAIGVGVALVAAALVPLFVFTPGFVAVVAVAVGVGCWELQRAIRTSGAKAPLVPLLAGTVLMTGLAWRAGPDALSLGLLVTVLGVMIWRLGDGPAGYQRDVTAATLIATYVPFLGGFAVLLAVPPDGAWRVLVTLAAVVLSDTGGYAAGVKFGKHPMAPTVSPKKSWEGMGGSVAASALGSALLLWLCLDVAPWWGALFGVAIAAVSVLGDLAESLIKRDLGVKDMSNLLPGHGGVMDRLDSILFAAPTAYLLLLLLAPVG
ncbi:phosphatidate cytidylyltransferase [Micromonosporaceae bacterium DT194]|uniref:phosphatidate cytidylyltransferase n=1 Tax=Melissospora conviva TaxID=3388432 RepID=UPI003C1FCBC6